MEIGLLIHFFRIHQDFSKDIHMLVSDADARELVHRLVAENCGINLHVYCKDKAALKKIRKAQDRAENVGADNRITYGEPDELLRCESIGTLVFDERIDYRLILELAGKKPQAVVGLMRGTNVSYMQLWEACMASVQYVYIRCLMNNTRIEVFDWKRGVYEKELSVIFPVYKVEAYLEKCIRSVTAWKAPYVEFLFVNDGSPDGSRKLLAEYAKKDPRIKIIDKENGGCASARQLGLERAVGRYVGFIDPDDFIEADMFRQLLGRAMLGGYELCYCGYNEYIESTGQIIPIKDVLEGDYAWGISERRLIQKLIINQRVAIWRGIYRRDFIEQNKIGFVTSLRRFDDLPFMVEVCAKARTAVALNQNLYYYRIGRPGQDVSCTDDRLYVHFDIFEHLDAIMDEMGEQRLKDYLQVRKLHTHLYAMRIIEDKYLKEYAERARKDLKRNAGVLRTLISIWRWSNRSEMRDYLRIMSGRTRAYRKGRRAEA